MVHGFHEKRNYLIFIKIFSVILCAALCGSLCKMLHGGSLRRHWESQRDSSVHVCFMNRDSQRIETFIY